MCHEWMSTMNVYYGCVHMNVYYVYLLCLYKYTHKHVYIFKKRNKFIYFFNYMNINIYM